MWNLAGCVHFARRASLPCVVCLLRDSLPFCFRAEADDVPAGVSIVLPRLCRFRRASSFAHRTHTNTYRTHTKILACCCRSFPSAPLTVRCHPSSVPGACAAARGVLHGPAVHAPRIDGCRHVRRARSREGAQEDDARSQGIRCGLAHAQVRSFCLCCARAHARGCVERKTLNLGGVYQHSSTYGRASQNSCSCLFHLAGESGSGCLPVIHDSLPPQQHAECLFHVVLRPRCLQTRSQRKREGYSSCCGVARVEFVVSGRGVLRGIRSARKARVAISGVHTGSM